MNDGLTVRRAMFVQEYLVDLNGTKAAIRSGYAPESAHVEASRLLSDAKVGAAVQEAMDHRAARLGVTQDRVVAELAKLGFANMMDYITVPEGGDAFVDLTTMTRDQAAALAEFTVEEYVEGRGPESRDVKRLKVKLVDKRAALVDLGRHIGMFKTSVELSAPGGGPVEFVIYGEREAKDAAAWQQDNPPPA